MIPGGLMATLLGVGRRIDTYFKNVTLLLSGEQNTYQYGGSVGPYVDISPNKLTCTAKITTLTAPAVRTPFPSIAGTGAIYLNGANSEYIAYPGPATASWCNIMGQDITVEAWIYQTATPVGTGAAQGQIVGNFSWDGSGSHYGWGLGVSSSNTIFFQSVQSGAGITASSAVAITNNTWNHVAFCSVGGVGTVYVNGVAGATTSNQFNVTNRQPGTHTLNAGWVNTASGDGYYTGYISNLRIVTGTAIYTTNFTPPTAPLTAVTGTQLLTFQGNGAVNNAYVQDAAHAYPFTPTGTPRLSSMTPFYPGGWSAYFPLGSSVTIASGAQPYMYGSSCYTVQFWINPSAFPANNCYLVSVLKKTTNSWAIVLGTDGRVGVTGPNTSSGTVTWSTAAALTIGKWHNIVWEVTGPYGGVLYVNADGGTGYFNSGTSDASAIYIGAANDQLGNTAYSFNGFISNFRYMACPTWNGMFRNWAGGVPAYMPTGPYGLLDVGQATGATITTLLFQDKQFIDNAPSPLGLTLSGGVRIAEGYPFSSNTKVPTDLGNSIYFNGTTDYLRSDLSGSYVVNNGLNDFTMDAWVYLTKTTTGLQEAYVMSTGTSSRFRLSFYNGQVDCYINGVEIYGGTEKLNQWTYLAATLTGATAKLYQDGVLIGTVGGASGNVGQNSLGWAIGTGAHAVGTVLFTGYIYQPRTIIGLLYSGAFTPPAAPADASSAAFALLGKNLGFLEHSGKSEITVGGGHPHIASWAKRFGSSSILFNGSPEYLIVNNSSGYVIGTGDFTMEAWVVWWTLSGSSAILSNVQTANTAYNFEFGVTSAGGNVMYFKGLNGTTINLAGNTTMTTGNWYHLAVSRTSNVIRMFVNGVLQTATYSTAANLTTNATTPIHIGGSPVTGNYLSGYIDDLRLTIGVGRYTSNFAVATAAAPVL